jgi:hypothetical protein
MEKSESFALTALRWFEASGALKEVLEAIQTAKVGVALARAFACTHALTVLVLQDAVDDADAQQYLDKLAQLLVGISRDLGREKAAAAAAAAAASDTPPSTIATAATDGLSSDASIGGSSAAAAAAAASGGDDESLSARLLALEARCREFVDMLSAKHSGSIARAQQLLGDSRAASLLRDAKEGAEKFIDEHAERVRRLKDSVADMLSETLGSEETDRVSSLRLL